MRPRSSVFAAARPRALVLLAALAALTLAAPLLRAQQGTPNTEAALEIRARFLIDLDTLQAKFLALAEAIPAEKYPWKPAEGVRSVGEAFMHVASEYYLYTPMAYGATPSPVIPRAQGALQAFEAKSTKADVQKHLAEGFAYMKQVIQALPAEKLAGSQKLFGGDRTIIETSFIMSGDLHEHLGQLITYARSVGVKPPWSK